MATNKHATIRYKILDECFGHRFRKYFIDDLIAVCSEKLSEHFMESTSISRRQILDDITFMKSDAGFEAPIETLREGKKGYYRYSDPDFSILKKPLTKTETEDLKQALLVLGRMKNIDQFDWVESIQTKLQFGLDEQKGDSQIMNFEENQHLKGVGYLGELYNYISAKQNLKIKYQPFSSNIIEFLLSPYYLKQYNNRWFLLGWNLLEDYLQTIALDRICTIENSKTDDYRENTIDFNEYFDDIIGVTNYQDKKVENVVIQLTDLIIPYIQTKPFHGSQRPIKDNLLKIQVKLNYELESLILSYGENMTVLEPIELKEKIKERVKKTKENY